MNLKRAFLAFAAFAFLVVAHGPVAVAQPTMTTDSVVTSPQLGADHKVTLNLQAPGAAKVAVTGDFAPNGAAMAKDAKGVWSYTTAVLPPGIYGYFFTVDGVRVIDPGDLFISSGAAHLKSYVEVPGDKDKPEFWEVRDVPHGVIHENLYKSPTLGNRRIIVYTPPGYEASAGQNYPVIYLYHGSTDNETYWMHVGQANYVMDNLIADGKVKPAICVACFGHTSIPPGPEQGPNGELYDVSAIENDLLHGIIPLVEKEYRVGKTSRDRAILGFSMGGYQTLTIGLNNPDTFAYVAGFSSGFRANQNLDTNFKGLLANLDKSKQAFKLVRIAVGTGEAGNIAPSRRVEQYLTAKGIQHEWLTPEGGTHTWNSWRGYFRDFMTQAFPPPTSTDQPARP